MQAAISQNQHNQRPGSSNFDQGYDMSHDHTPQININESNVDINSQQTSTNATTTNNTNNTNTNTNTNTNDNTTTSSNIMHRKPPVLQSMSADPYRQSHRHHNNVNLTDFPILEALHPETSWDNMNDGSNLQNGNTNTNTKTNTANNNNDDSHSPFIDHTINISTNIPDNTNKPPTSPLQQPMNNNPVLRTQPQLRVTASAPDAYGSTSYIYIYMFIFICICITITHTSRALLFALFIHS